MFQKVSEAVRVKQKLVPILLKKIFAVRLTRICPMKAEKWGGLWDRPGDWVDELPGRDSRQVCYLRYIILRVWLKDGVFNL